MIISPPTMLAIILFAGLAIRASVEVPEVAYVFAGLVALGIVAWAALYRQ